MIRKIMLNVAICFVILANSFLVVSAEVIPQISAQAAVVLDKSSGRVLYEKNAYKTMSIASTTKIMTAILAIENGKLDEIVTVSKRSASIGGSVINLRKDEKIKLEHLLYGLMLESGNDAAIAIAEHIGGSVEGFVQKMNDKAKDLNLVNTSFKTPHGLDVEGHYSSAYELAQLARYALENKLFSKIVSTKSIVFPGGRGFSTTNEMLSSFKGCDGVKTGYTGLAGRCLVSSATRNGMKLISVVLNCATRQEREKSSTKILDYAFNEYYTYCLLKKGELLGQIEIKKGSKELTNVYSEEEISIPLSKIEIEGLERVLKLEDVLRAPVYDRMEVGKLSFQVNQKELCSTKILTNEDINKKTYMDYVSLIFYTWKSIFH